MYARFESIYANSETTHARLEGIYASFENILLIKKQL